MIILYLSLIISIVMAVFLICILIRLSSIKSFPESFSSSSFKTAIWSGGDKDWQDLIGVVDFIFVATALPQQLTPDISDNFGNAFNNITATPDLYFKPSLISTQDILLSIGGSVANIDGWLKMTKTAIQDWVSYFTILKQKYGINGIDWDIEPDSLYGDSKDNDTIAEFIGTLSKELKQKDSAYKISVTIFGNKDKYVLNKSIHGMLEKYIDYIDIIPIMLYNGGMWRDDTWGSWCKYATDFFAIVSKNVQNKILYAVWTASQQKNGADCCASCVYEIIQNVQKGQGAGIALWCYGGYLGACSNFKEVNLSLLKTLKKSGINTTFQELQDAFSEMTIYRQNPLYCLKNGCGLNSGCMSYTDCQNSCKQ